MCAPTSVVILKLYFLWFGDFLCLALLLSGSNFLDRAKDKALVLMLYYGIDKLKGQHIEL